jgi:hypothetical protein
LPSHSTDLRYLSPLEYFIIWLKIVITLFQKVFEAEREKVIDALPYGVSFA